MSHQAPVGRRPFRVLRARTTGRLRSLGWVWWLAMLWVAIGAGGAIYGTITFTHVGYDQDVMWMVQWPGEPQVLYDAAVVALPVWVLMSPPVLLAGIVRLRGWRLRNWLEMAGWTASWVAGLVLMVQTRDLAAAGEGGTHGVLSVEEMAICGAWLVLGGAMTAILLRTMPAPAPASVGSLAALAPRSRA